jgi:hypothetical protein
MMIDTHRLWNFSRGAIGRAKGRFLAGSSNSDLAVRFLLRQLMFRTHARIAGQPQLNAFMKRSIARVPALDRRLRALIRTDGASRLHAAQMYAAFVDMDDLTPRARQVYHDLVKSVMREQ